MAEQQSSAAGWPDAELHKVQAVAEEADASGFVEFRGKKFRLGPSIGESAGMISMLEFAEAAANGEGSADPAGLAAMYDLLRGCFMLSPSCGDCEACNDERYHDCAARDEGDWPKFRRLARAVQASGDEVLDIVNQVMEQSTARPTKPRTGSSGTPQRTSERSRALSSSAPEAFRKAELIDVRDALR